MKKVEKLRKWMAVNDYDGIILGRRDNYTWISDGAKNHVTSNTETGVAYYVIEPDHIWLFADSSDLPRMSKEQNPLGAEPVLVPWYMSMEERLKETAQGKKICIGYGNRRDCKCAGGACRSQDAVVGRRGR